MLFVCFVYVCLQIAYFCKPQVDLKLINHPTLSPNTDIGLCLQFNLSWMTSNAAHEGLFINYNLHNLAFLPIYFLKNHSSFIVVALFCLSSLVVTAFISADLISLLDYFLSQVRVHSLYIM